MPIRQRRRLRHVATPVVIAVVGAVCSPGCGLGAIAKRTVVLLAAGPARPLQRTLVASAPPVAMTASAAAADCLPACVLGAAAAVAAMAVPPIAVVPVLPTRRPRRPDLNRSGLPKS